MTVFCSEANASLMVRQGRACLLLWGRRYSGGDADSELDMDWIHPWIALDWIGLDWVR